MGFIASTITVSKYGISVPNAQVTIKGSLVVQKKGNNLSIFPLFGLSPILINNQLSEYNIISRYYVYGSSDYSSLSPIFEDTIIVPSETPPENVYTAVYDAIKALFPDATFTDN